MAPIRKSEEEVGRIWDRCFVDTSIKAASGTLVGSIFSLIFFKRKAWPITLGLGIGIGAGYTNCRHQFWWRRHYRHPHFDGHKHRPSGPPFWRGPPFRKDKEQLNDKKEEAPKQTDPEPQTPQEKPADS
ncbi:uncharacterized protein LOC110251615 [Exaiptasia diaphana]|uniref:MICOS complex subunit MIC10 n=1 Tax=Exaiptasia diaphana TaxID=2652724 RepID=A0A913Y328_EXADI|nr:uncharacterized protein LOC110251615 [Exaiptasia diaphana]